MDPDHDVDIFSQMKRKRKSIPEERDCFTMQSLIFL